MKNQCEGIFGWLFGHKFKPVITRSAVKGAPYIEATTATIHKLMECHRDEEFHGSICQRCGAGSKGKL